MSTFNYFSYGSNMLTERLQARCPSAKLIGRAEVKGYQIAFSKLSNKDGSGKAAPIPHSHNAQTVYGILFEIDRRELERLDCAEGRGYGYDRVDDFKIVCNRDAKELGVTTYMANADFIDPDLQPFDWYLALVIAGAGQHALPNDYIERLREVPCIPDANLERPTRLEALEALRAVDAADFHKLF